MENKISECYEKAKEVLKICSTPNGFFASGGKEGYDAIWARDSMISSIGASLVEDSNEEKELFKKTFKASLKTLAENQGKTGQIPNCVDKFSRRKPHVDYKTIDSTLWYIIGSFVYQQRYEEESLSKLNQTTEKAMNWLLCQDQGEEGMLAQLPTSDWQDAFPHKYGYAISTQALFFKVLKLMKKEKEAEKLKFMTNENVETNLWNKNFYLPYRWKNHGIYKEVGYWFDSLGNLLSIIFDLATNDKAKKILSYIKSKKIADPYPIRSIYPPLTKKSKFWQDYFMDCDAKEPHSYANGGIWGFVGCFYVLSLIKLKKFEEAEKALSKIAELNLKGNFPEWTHPITKKSYGNLQAWEAGTFILAYKSLKEKKVLI